MSSEHNGSVKYIDLENMSVITEYSGSDFTSPYSACLNADGNKLYIGSGTGNFIYKLNVTDATNPLVSIIVIANGESPDTSSAYNPTQIFLHPDGNKYYVACRGTNEIRVFNTGDDSFIKTITVGIGPQKFAYSSSRNYLIAACTEDTVSVAGKRGSISFIDCASDVKISSVYPGSQPRGMIVDEENQRIIVANRNFSSDGPAPHHVTECEGRNGYMTYIDLNTLQLIPGQKFEVSVDPYSVVLRN